MIKAIVQFRIPIFSYCFCILNVIAIRLALEVIVLIGFVAAVMPCTKCVLGEMKLLLTAGL